MWKEFLHNAKAQTFLRCGGTLSVANASIKGISWRQRSTKFAACGHDEAPERVPIAYPGTSRDPFTQKHPPGSRTAGLLESFSVGLESFLGKKTSVKGPSCYRAKSIKKKNRCENVQGASSFATEKCMAEIRSQVKLNETRMAMLINQSALSMFFGDYKGPMAPDITLSLYFVGAEKLFSLYMSRSTTTKPPDGSPSPTRVHLGTPSHRNTHRDPKLRDSNHSASQGLESFSVTNEERVYPVPRIILRDEE